MEILKYVKTIFKRKKWPLMIKLNQYPSYKKSDMKMNKKYTPHPQISLERLTTMIATALIHSNKTAVM